MCGPFAIPLALVAAGTMANYFGQKQASHAQARAYGAEQARQKDMTEKQQGLFDESLKASTALTDPNAQSKAVGDRQSTLAAAIASPSDGSYLPGSSSAPGVVQAASDKAIAGSKAYSGNLAKTLAQLGGTSDLLQKTNISMGRDGGQIGQLASFKQGSAGVLDAEMRAAAQKGAFLRNAGSLAQSIGMAWLGAAGAGAAAGGASAGAVTAPGITGASASPFALGPVSMPLQPLPVI